jgi:hypothetical protein
MERMVALLKSLKLLEVESRGLKIGLSDAKKVMRRPWQKLWGRSLKLSEVERR